MKIQFASDLHLEFPHNKEFMKANPLQPTGDVLVLAGDIVPFAAMDKHKDFFRYVSDHFHTTWWLPGNHEYYQYDLSKKCGSLNEKIRSNVHLVNNLTVQQDDVRFIFSTLWSKINPADAWYMEMNVSDFHVIRCGKYRFSADQFNRLHEKCLDFVATELQQLYTGKTVVATHHVPTLLNYPEMYKDSLLNDAFAVELFDLIETTGPDCWIYGHHHHNARDFSIGKTRMLTNQVGYVKAGEHRLFDLTKTIEL